MPTSHRPIAIFSGGSAANSLSPIFTTLATSKSCPLAYIIPISDNGGSSSELIRVFGGPGIGDVRSRLVRLIPRLSKSSPGWKEREGIRALLSHRLSSGDARTARAEWNDIVDGTSALWKEISSAKKELIRSIFNLVNLEIIKRSRPPSSTFDFTSASAGNLFLTGARLFTGSFESAIYLMSSVCGINDEDVKVVPSINSNFSHHIAAGLEDGSVIVGQNAISHPSPATEGRDGKVVAKMTGFTGGINAFGRSATSEQRRDSAEHYYGDEEGRFRRSEQEDVEEEDANLPGTLPNLRTKNITFNKHENEELPARISRIWYINPYGQEILPPANPRAITALSNAQSIIYSIGSLYTSLAPSLILKGVGAAIKSATKSSGSRLRTKILILNGSLDREVGPLAQNGAVSFTALDFVEAIIRAGEQSRGVAWEGSRNVSKEAQASDTTTATSILQRGASLSPRRPELSPTKSESFITTLTQRSPGQNSHLFPPPLPASSVPSRDPSPSSPPSHTPSSANLAGAETTPYPLLSFPAKVDPIYTAYVTHLIHLPNSATTPFVDRELLLMKYGIRSIKVYGRKEDGGEGGMRYDHAALRGAIEAIIGPNPERSDPGRGQGSGARDQNRDTDGNENRRANGENHEDSESDANDDSDGGALKRRLTRDEERRKARTRIGSARSTGRRNTLDLY